MADGDEHAVDVEISVAPVFTFFTRRLVTASGSLPRRNLVDRWSNRTSTFGRADSRSCSTRSARNESRRCTTVTLAAILQRYSASSTAVLPPPTTITFLPRKKKPSQVAQAETP